jgi:glycosyltransferase involved in cell wall biosynthesis
VHADADLVARLESPLPASVPAGGATAVFCYGHCFHRRADVARLDILVDGRRHRPSATRMPRPDVFGADGAGRSFLSGFWGIVPLHAAPDAGAIDLALAVRLRAGGEIVAPLGRVPIAPLRAVESGGVTSDPMAAAPTAGPAPARIAICMATYEPDRALLRAQLDSLRAQTDRDWACVISDDCSSREGCAALLAEVGDDARFAVSRSDRRLGFYRNFERALRLAPADAPLIALCDQDDVWRPEKLAVLRAALGSAQLAYSDQRLVDADGRVLRETLWRGRRNNHTDLSSLLVANTITGAATLFRREVAELALPFPDTPGLQFHDHWIALAALASGDVAYVDRPLYDYVQHRGAFFGEVTHGAPPPPSRRRGMLRGGRGAYFLGYLARATQAEALLARCGNRMAPRKRRALRRFAAAERSFAAFAALALRPLRVLVGRTETLGSETELVRGIVWRHAVALLAAGARAPGRRPCDASLPGLLAFEQRRLRRWRARV